MAATAGRFGDGDLAAIAGHLAGGGDSDVVTVDMAHSSQPGTSAWEGVRAMSHAPAAFTLGELRVRYHRLWRHVTDDHGLQVCGTAGQIDAVRRRLRLPYLRRHAPEVLATAKAQRWDPTEVLRVLLVEEATGRDTATRAQRRKAAGFPSGKTLDAWDTRAPSIPAPTQTALATLEWVARAENLAVCGPSVDLAAAELTLEEFEKLL